MIMKTFEEFLQEEFMDLRELGGIPITKDNCEDLFENWLESLDGNDYIEFGNKFGIELSKISNK